MCWFSIMLHKKLQSINLINEIVAIQADKNYELKIN